MDKENVIKITQTYTHKILLIHKKEWNFAICDKMDRHSGHYIKWNKSEKDKYHVITLICGIWKTNKQETSS